MHFDYLIITDAVILVGCSTSNKITNSRKNPEVDAESAGFQTMAVSGMVKDHEIRRGVEGAITGLIVNISDVPSYKMITNEELSYINTLKQKPGKGETKGVLILSVRSINIKTSRLTMDFSI